MQVYEAYVENGQIYPINKIKREPNRIRAIITVLDEFIHEENIDNSKKDFWEEIEEFYGIVRSDIDEKKELADAKDEKYASIN